jgi:16S rRNA (cytidine1402-2'-O)-methyltransferase
VPIKNNPALQGQTEPTDAKADCKPSRPKPDPGLYIIATPIGNARDISLRALETLKGADLVLCEDTRVTKKLFAYHQISNTLMAYHEHNAKRMRPQIIKRLECGESVALVSDAGTPLVSDPGYRLVEACIEEGIPFTTLPGASSVLSALVLSGLPTDKFYFHGFLPSKSGQRQRALAELEEIPGSLVFLESAKRLTSSLSDIHAVLGDRSCAVTRELTKLYEEVRRGYLSELASYYTDHGPPKGEITLVVGPAIASQPPEGEALDAMIIKALKTQPVKSAAAVLAAETGLAKRDLYNRAIELKTKNE